jgi:hypothetical protein
MEKLHTSLNIIRHSLVVLIRHPQLLWFVAIELALGFLAYRFYFTPVFETSTEAMRSAASSGQGWDGNPAAHFPYGMIALAYLPGMFLATFFNVALYSQILQALNGGQVSLARGLALAREKLPAIIAWSLLAGTVGMLQRDPRALRCPADSTRRRARRCSAPRRRPGRSCARSWSGHLRRR